MNFIKKIFQDQSDKKTHQHFIRFGKGEFKKRFVLNFRQTKKIKVKSSFEFANNFISLCANFGKCKVSGIVLSKEDISQILSENNIQGNSETKKGGLYFQNNILEQELSKEQLLKIEEVSYFCLLDLDGEDFKLKIKKKLPKPGKDENKIDDKFCQLEADEKYCQKIKEDFFWDCEGKKINVHHNIFIDKIITPKNEKDYAKIRELAKRVGKIIRVVKMNEKEIKKEINFEI